MDGPLAVTRIALWWVRIACYLALLMPLVTLPGVIYPHVFGKSLYLYSVLILTLPAYAILLLDTRYRPPVTPILQGLVILFAVTLLATLFAHDPALSFWSYPARMTGLWSLLHFGLFFLLLSVFRDPGEWRRLVLFSISISLVVAIITLAEKFDSPLDTGAWDERSGSLLGNPAFLSAYLLFNLFFALWRLDEARRWTGRAVFVLILTLQLGALAQAATRGALVALILGLLLYGLLRLAPPASGGCWCLGPWPCAPPWRCGGWESSGSRVSLAWTGLPAPPWRIARSAGGSSPGVSPGGGFGIIPSWGGGRKTFSISSTSTLTRACPRRA